jgi:hypothetical protein
LPEVLRRFIESRTQFPRLRFLRVGELLDRFLARPLLLRLAGIHLFGGFGFLLLGLFGSRLLTVLDEIKKCHSVHLAMGMVGDSG